MGSATQLASVSANLRTRVDPTGPEPIVSTVLRSIMALCATCIAMPPRPAMATVFALPLGAAPASPALYKATGTQAPIVRLACLRTFHRRIAELLLYRYRYHRHPYQLPQLQLARHLRVLVGVFKRG